MSVVRLICVQAQILVAAMPWQFVVLTPGVTCWMILASELAYQIARYAVETQL